MKQDEFLLRHSLLIKSGRKRKRQRKKTHLKHILVKCKFMIHQKFKTKTKTEANHNRRCGCVGISDVITFVDTRHKMLLNQGK